LEEFHHAATPSWQSIGSNRERWSDVLGSLRRPVPSLEESEPYLLPVLAQALDALSEDCVLLFRSS
jgi:hypothetical protein